MDKMTRANIAYPMRAADVGERLAAFEERGSFPACRAPGPVSSTRSRGWARPSSPSLMFHRRPVGSCSLASIPRRSRSPPVTTTRASSVAGFGLDSSGSACSRSPTHGAEDEAFARQGNGLTDIVKRPTDATASVSGEELAAGADLLRVKVRTWQPGLILFAFKGAATALLGSSIGPGRGPEFERSAAFLLTGPYARTADAGQNDKALARLVRARGRSLG